MKATDSFLTIFMLVLTLTACKQSSKPESDMSDYKISLIQVNPGHFHAGLVQKSMYKQVDPVVHVYAPAGPDVEDYQNRVNSYNTRDEEPTSWSTELYTGTDYLEKLLSEKPGNVMVTSGNNSRKTEYIKQAVEAGLNVCADKPMVITPDEFPLLLEAFRISKEKGVLLYDIMTERYEISTILQREFSMIPELFGELVTGTPDEPAITKESVHHIFKYISGSPVKRPGWFFDATQQGTGLADIGTHLVDLVQWECFPEQIIDYKSDIEVINSRAWPTVMDLEQFENVTGLAEFPEYLNSYLEGGKLNYGCNGEMSYTLKGIHAKVSVVWNYQAPEGTGDTHYSIMRGTKCNLIIRQGPEEGYKPTLYIEAVQDSDGLEEVIGSVITENITSKYPGVAAEKISDQSWKLQVPDSYKVGHEAHFAQVMNKYLDYLENGNMPEWEIPNMIAKYYTTTRSLEASR
jgi:predicted dehydrogenase